MKLKIEVNANSFNDSGYYYIIYRVWACFKWEIGRVENRSQLESFMKEYSEMNGKTFDVSL